MTDKMIEIGMLPSVIVSVAVIGAGLLVWWFISWRTSGVKKSIPLGEGDTADTPADSDSIPGTGGKYPCYVLADGKMVPSKIPSPIGNLFMSEPSMPLTGNCYLVKSVGEKLEAYDPREIPFESTKSPEWAYFATHWDKVKDVYSVPVPWWGSPATWMVIGCMVLLAFSLILMFG